MKTFTIVLTDDQAKLVSHFVELIKTPETPPAEIGAVLGKALTRGVVDFIPTACFFKAECLKKSGGVKKKGGIQNEQLDQEIKDAKNESL